MKKLVILASLVAVVVGCGKKGTSPEPPGIINEFGEEFMATYEVVSAIGSCFANCVWDTVSVDTVTLCLALEINPFLVTSDSAGLFFVDEEEGIISDTAIEIIYKGRIGILIDGDTCLADFTLTISTKYRSEPEWSITKEGWQIYISMKFQGCAVQFNPPTKVTYRRIEECGKTIR